MASYNYHSAIPWHILKKYLEKRQLQVLKGMVNSKDDETLKLQGRGQELEQLLNLPEILAGLEEENVEAKS